MSAETVAQLFQPFSQADSSTSRKYGGSGLGLSISQRLIQMMGGDIRVESQPGQGSLFTFTVPLGCQAGVGAEARANTHQVSGQRILVVDDNIHTLEALRSALIAFNCIVTVAQSAEAGFALLNSQVAEGKAQYALVLMDSSLPGMDGVEAIRRIKHDPFLGHIPVLLMLGTVEMLQQKEFDDLDGYLIKPITRSQLFDAILQILGQKTHLTTRTDTKHHVINAAREKLRGVQILLVEDNEINQLVAMDVLQSIGLQVTIANDGNEALDLVKNNHFDAVLMDIQMPGMDGYQTTVQIRQDEHANAAQLPIIAMTANAMESDRQKALEAGMNDYVSKPVDVATLASVLLRSVNLPAVKTIAVAASEIRRTDDKDATPELARGELPSTLGSINMVAALTRLGDNKQLYKRLLLLFHTEHEHTAQAIRVALKNDDIERARRLVHTLKGVAGTVGADELAAAVKQLDQAIAGGKELLYNKYLDQMEQKLANVMVSIARIE
jgi:CheY-like chemotaxis protein